MSAEIAQESEPATVLEESSEEELFPRPIAYYVAASMLLFNVALAVVSLVTGTASFTVIGAFFDFVLGLGLLFKNDTARAFVIFRASLGLIFGPILHFVLAEGHIGIGLFMSLIQAIWCAGLIIVLTGRSENWRLAAGIFAVLQSLVIYGVIGVLYYR